MTAIWWLQTRQNVSHHFQILLLEGQCQLIVVNARGCSHIQRRGAPHSCKDQMKLVEHSVNSPTKNKSPRNIYRNINKTITQANATVLEKVAEVVKHRTLILTTDPAEIAEKAATVRHHTRESDLLLQESTFQKQSS